jgi:hypothetical protein
MSLLDFGKQEIVKSHQCLLVLVAFAQRQIYNNFAEDFNSIDFIPASLQIQPLGEVSPRFDERPRAKR